MLEPEKLKFDAISIVALNPGLRERVLQLKLDEKQGSFLPDVASSLEDAEKYEDAYPFAIKEGSEVVGFGLYGVDEQTGNWKLFRLMIDKIHQGRGLGEKAMIQVIAELRQRRGAQDILLCYQEDNEAARNLYKKLGFIEYGKDGPKVLAKLLAAQPM
jgi:diamine N-acetyltransferase